MKTKHWLIPFVAIVLALAACTHGAASKAPVGSNVADSLAIITLPTETAATDSPLVQRIPLRTMFIRAIGDFITAVYQKDKRRFDTLYFGKHTYGQPDDFPNITLPASIQGTRIFLLSNEECDSLHFGSTSAYINMMGSMGDTTEFVIVTMSSGFHHSFDCFINYTYNAAQREFGPGEVLIEDYLFDRQGKLQRIPIYKKGKYIGDKME